MIRSMALAIWVRMARAGKLTVAKLDIDQEAIHTLAPGRKAWLQVAKGEVKLCGETLKAGDAAAITDQDKIAIRSKEPSEVLLFDLA